MTQEALVALRELLNRNPCAIQLGPEELSDLICREGYASYRMAAHEVEWAIEALRVEGEVLA